MTDIAAKSLNHHPLNLRLAEFLQKLIEPSVEIKGVQRRNARLLSSLLLAVATVVSAFALLTRIFPNLTPYSAVSQPIILAVVGLLWVVYGLSRTRHYIVTVWITLMVIDLSIFSLAIMQRQQATTSILDYAVLGLLISSLLLTARDVIILAAFKIIGMLLLVSYVPGFPKVASSVGFTAMMTALLLVFIRHRNLLEQDRQADLSSALKRTEEANEALVKANALTRETMRLKSEFMSTMSHELRTPLNAIAGFCGIMLEGMGGELDSEAQHMVTRIQLNSDRLLALINQVLDLAKIEADRLDLVTVPISPRTLIERWKTQVSVLAEKKGLSFETEVDPALPAELIGDPERLTQIAVNLLSNAFKFTETGGVKLIAKRQETTWILQVRDTGIGIPPHALNYIFDEFRQLDGSSTRVYGGSGLGLAIVRKLCMLMDGSVRAESELGKGSIFTVTLPLKVSETASLVAE